MATNKIIIGFLLLVVLTASIYILLPNQVRIDIGKTSSSFMVYENNAWVLAGTEYTKIYDGSSLMRANNRIVNYTLDISNNLSTIYRYAYFKNNITAIDIYKFDGCVKDVESIPISHEIRILNGKGKILQYEVNNILYDGITQDITSPFAFGHNMEVEWEKGSYYSKVFQQKLAPDKLIIKYKINSNDDNYEIRLFDPTAITFNNSLSTENLTFSDNENITRYLTLPKNSVVNSAYLNLTGYNSTGTFGDGSDGSLYFTTGTKSYGSLTENVDYTVSGNTLYLNLNQIYQFTNFTLGVGTTLSTLNTTGTMFLILVQNTSDISGIVNSQFSAAGGVTNTFNYSGTTYTSPSVGAAGSGGIGRDFIGNSFGGGGGSNGFGGGGNGGGVTVSTTYYNSANPLIGASGSSSIGGSVSGTNVATAGGEPGVVRSSQGSAGNSGSGGSTGASVVRGCDGSATSATGGSGGGGSYGAAGGAGSASDGDGVGCYASAGGGGGSGGNSGKPGIHFYLSSNNINFTGVINTNGTSGTNGGAGNNGAVDAYASQGFASGGGGGGGGAGGNGGNIYFNYSTIIQDSGTKNMNGGTGGTGGAAGSTVASGGFTAYAPGAGGNGASGTNGNFNTSIGSEETGFPTNPYLEIGTTDGNYEWKLEESLGDGSDGDLYFTTGTKTFGNLTYGIDYTNTSTNLYLMLDHEYNFNTFYLGAGTTLSSNNNTGTIMLIQSLSNATIAGSVSLNGVLSAGNLTTSYVINNHLFENSGVPMGGSGGAGWPNGGGGNGGYGFGGGGGTGVAACGGAGSDGAYSGGNGGFIGTYGYTTGSIQINGGARTTAITPTNGSGAGGAACADSPSSYGYGGNGGYNFGGDGVGATNAAASGSNSAAASGGGGGGGGAGKAGIHLYLSSTYINFTGTIDTSGTNGFNGAGGTNPVCVGFGAAGGGGGGGGGAGGNGGNIYFIANEVIQNTGTKTSNGGSGGTGGSGGGVACGWSDPQAASAGSTGSTGRNGSYGLNSLNNTFNFTEKTLDLSAAINSALSGGTCSGGTLDGDNCTIPFLFHSDTSGIIQYSNIEVEYDEEHYPLIDWGIGTLDDGSVVTQTNIYANTTWIEADFANITFSLQEPLEVPPTTQTFTDPTWAFNWTSKSPGFYTYNVTICNTLNFCNSTSTRNITLESTINNNITLISPNNSIYLNYSNVNFKANITNNINVSNATLNIYNLTGVYNKTLIELSSPLCYQETATVATSCGGLSTGSYGYSVLSGDIIDVNNWKDGNYMTAATKSGASSTAFLYVNYTLPLGVTNATWLVVDNQTSNLTIPSECLNNVVQLRVNMSRTSSVAGNPNGTVLWDCFNGSSFLNLRNSGVTTNYASVTEEAIYWSSSKTNILLDILVNVIDGVYTWFYQATDLDNNNFISTNYTVTVDTTYPQIDWGIGTLPSGSNVTGDNIYMNTTWTETNFDDITFNVYNQSGLYSSYGTSSQMYANNFTSIWNGLYYYNVTVCDLASNCNSTSTRNITINRSSYNFVQIPVNLSCGITTFKFNAKNSSGTFPPFNQTASCGILNITNNQSTQIIVAMSINDTNACATDYANSINNVATSKLLTPTANTTIITSVAPGESAMIWMWTRYSCAVTKVWTPRLSVWGGT